MDEKGMIHIPVAIQEEMDVRQKELPEFHIKAELLPKPHIALYPINNTPDNSKFIEPRKE